MHASRLPLGAPERARIPAQRATETRYQSIDCAGALTCCQDCGNADKEKSKSAQRHNFWVGQIVPRRSAAAEQFVEQPEIEPAVAARSAALDGGAGTGFIDAAWRRRLDWRRRREPA